MNEPSPLMTSSHVGRMSDPFRTSQSTDANTVNNSSLIDALNLPCFLIFLIIHLFSD